MSANIFSQLQNALRRSTAPNTIWLREVDGLRFIAIFAVVLQHLLERFANHTTLLIPQPILDDPFAFFISRGTVGVFLFFAISGFVLALPFAKFHLEGAKRPGLWAYFTRRVTRLEPPYIVWMSVFAAILLLKGAFSLGEIAPHLFASLTYTHGLFFGAHSPINPVAWSLEVEIQFYILAPFLAAVFFGIKDKVARRLVLGATIIGWEIVQSHFGWWLFPYKLSILGQLPHFLIGFLIADCYLTDWKTAPCRRLAWDLVAPVAYVIMCYTWTTHLWANIVFSAALFVLFAAAFRGVYFRKILQNGWIAIGGGMCYTIYLTHLPLLEAVTTLTRNIVLTDKIWVNYLIQVAICLPVIWLLGAAFFWVLEKPFMRFSLADWQAKWVGFRRQNGSTLPRPAYFSFQNLANKIPFVRGRFGIFGLLLLSPFFLQAQISAPKIPTEPTTDSLRLRSLEQLIENALQIAPELKANRTDLAKQTLAAEIQRKSWTDMFTVNGAGYYGNGIVNEIRSVDGADLNYATGRLGTGVNLTLGIKISGGDIATRRQKNQIQVLQLDRIESENQMIQNQIRDLVTAQYFQLENVLEMVKLRAESLESMRLALAVAEKYFKEGNLPIGEYTTLLTQETTAHGQFLQAQNEAKQRAVALRNLTGGEIWLR